MDETRVTEEYLLQFPTRLRTALEQEKNREKFIKEVVEEYDEILVYRGIHRKNEVHGDDFLGNIEERELYGKGKLRKETLDGHAVSVNEDKQQLLTALSIPNPKNQILGIAQGYMRCLYGPADFKVKNNVQCTHHNWYIFEGKSETIAKEFASIEL